MDATWYIHTLAESFAERQKGVTFADAMNAIPQYVKSHSGAPQAKNSSSEGFEKKLVSACQCSLTARHFPEIDIKFHIEELLGEGGNGFVFRATEKANGGRTLALKLRKANSNAIVAEIKVLGKISEVKAGVASLVESFSDEAGPYGFSMAYIPGKKLRDVISTTARVATTPRDRFDSPQPAGQAGGSQASRSCEGVAPDQIEIEDSPLLLRFFSFTPLRWIAHHLVSCAVFVFPLSSVFFRPLRSAVNHIETRNRLYRDAAEHGLAMSTVMTKVHDAGVIHRDLKPENLLVYEGSIHIIDFGLSRIIHDQITESDVSSPFETSCFEPNPVGTRLYMSPEQFQKDAEPLLPTDVFSLGLILHEFVTGRPANGGVCHKTFAESAGHIPALAEIDPCVPRPLNDIVRHATLSEARKRPTMRELEHELRRYLDGFPTKYTPFTRSARLAMWIRRNPWIAAFIASVALCFMLGLMATLHFVIEQQRQFDLLTANAGLDTIDGTLEEDPGAATVRAAAHRNFNPEVSARATEIQTKAARLNHVVFEEQSDLTAPTICSLADSPLTAFFCSRTKMLQLLSSKRSTAAVIDVKMIEEIPLQHFSDFLWDPRKKELLTVDRSPQSDTREAAVSFSVWRYDAASGTFTKHEVVNEGFLKNPTIVCSERLGFFVIDGRKLWRVIRKDGYSYSLEELLTLPQYFDSSKTVAAVGLDDGLLCVTTHRACRISNEGATGWRADELTHVSAALNKHFAKVSIDDLSQLRHDGEMLLLSGEDSETESAATLLLSLQDKPTAVRLEGRFTAPDSRSASSSVFAVLSRGTATVNEVDDKGNLRELLSLQGVDRLSFNNKGTSVWHSKANEQPAKLYIRDLALPESRLIPVPQACTLISLAHVPINDADFCFAFTDGSAESRMIRLFSPLTVSERYSPRLSTGETFSHFNTNSGTNRPLFSIDGSSVSFMIDSEPQTQIFEINGGTLTERQVLPGVMIDPTFDDRSLLIRGADTRQLSHFKKTGEQFTRHTTIDTDNVQHARYLHNCSAFLYRTEHHLFVRKASGGASFPVSKWHSDASLHDFSIQSLANGATFVLLVYKDGSASLLKINHDLTIQTFELPDSVHSTAFACTLEIQPRGLRAALLGTDGNLTIIDISTEQNSPQFKVSFDATIPALERRQNQSYLTRLIFSPTGRFLVIAPQTQESPIWLLELNTTPSVLRKIQVTLPDSPSVLAQWMSMERILFISTEKSLQRIDLANSDSGPELTPTPIPDACPNNLVVARIQNEERLLTIEQRSGNTEICIRDSDGKRLQQHPVSAPPNAALRISNDQRFLATTIQPAFVAKMDFGAKQDSAPTVISFRRPVTQRVISNHSHDTNTQIVFYEKHCEVFTKAQPPRSLEYLPGDTSFSVTQVQPLNNKVFLLLTAPQINDSTGQKKQQKCCLTSFGNNSTQASLESSEVFVKGNFVTSDGIHVVSRSENTYYCYKVINSPPKLQIAAEIQAGQVPADSHAQIHLLPSGQTVLMLLHKTTRQITYLVFETAGQTKNYPEKDWQILPNATSVGEASSDSSKTAEEIYDFLLFQNKLQIATRKGISEWHFRNSEFAAEERLHPTIDGPAWLLTPPVNMAACVAERDRLVLLPSDPNIPGAIHIPFRLNASDEQIAAFVRSHRTWHCDNNGSTVVIIPGETLECWPIECFYANEPGQRYPGEPAIRLAPRNDLFKYEKKLFPRL